MVWETGQRLLSGENYKKKSVCAIYIKEKMTNQNKNQNKISERTDNRAENIGSDIF